MAANYTRIHQKCYETGIFQPDETPPPHSLLIAAVTHIYLVVILGTLCNGIAIWCVVTCKKTRVAVKVFLCSIFVPVLLICLVTRSMRSKMMFAVLRCDRVSMTYIMITTHLYSFLAQMELACITALAIVRTVAVWSPQRHTIKLRVAVIVVISIFIYSFFTGAVILRIVWSDYVRSESLKLTLTIIYFFINVMLPFFVTAIAYALMMYAMRQNRQRLAISESRTSSSTSTVLDQATRAMIAVFISNLIFGFPHAVYHLSISKYTHTLELVFHMIFYTHFVVDPIVFIWYNNTYRQRVREKVHAAWKLTLGCCKASSLPGESLRKISSTLPLWKPSLSSLQNSSSSASDQGGIQLPGGVLTEV